MKAEQAKQLAQSALSDLEAALRAGKSEELTAYLAAMGRFHRYSFTNMMLIVSQRPDATRVAGFSAWKKLNRFVKKGEKGIMIIAPMIRPKSEDDDDKKNAIRGFRAAYVFDIAQTEGDDLPAPLEASGDPGAFTARLTDLYSALGITLVEVDDLGGALGRSSGGRVEIQAGLCPAEHFQVLVHELAHEQLHQVKGVERPVKMVRELEAEAVAAVVSSAIGLDAIRSSADYIQLYSGDVELFQASMNRIQKTSAMILDAIIARVETPA